MTKIDEMIAAIQRHPGRDLRHYFRLGFDHATQEQVAASPRVRTRHLPAGTEGDPKCTEALVTHRPNGSCVTCGRNDTRTNIVLYYPAK